MQLPAITSPLVAPPLASLKANGATNKPTDGETSAAQNDKPAATAGTRQAGTQALSESDKRAIAELKKIDRDVRAHEAAHLAAGGGLVRSGVSFSYTQGPDGQRYAVGGEVSIDTSPERDDPEGTILKAQRIQAAALAPAQPSNADRAVAAGAAQMASSARAELITERYAAAEPAREAPQTRGVVAGMTRETTAIDNEASRRPEPVTDLYKLINRITTAEDSAGNLLNTTV